VDLNEGVALEYLQDEGVGQPGQRDHDVRTDRRQPEQRGKCPQRPQPVPPMRQPGERGRDLACRATMSICHCGSRCLVPGVEIRTSPGDHAVYYTRRAEALTNPLSEASLHHMSRFVGLRT